MITAPKSHEHDAPVPDFRPQLRLAMKNAVVDTPEDPLKNGDAPELFRDVEDDYVVSFLHVPGESQVYTTSPDDYRELLRQAAEVLDGATDLDPEDTNYLEAAAAHELKHGEVAASFGNSDTVSYYGVEFVRYDNGDLGFWPYHFTSGPLKKVHRAWSVAAPDDRSSTDMDIVRSLGYGEDVEALRARALAEPPVEEGWERVINREDVLRALQNLALRAGS